MNDVFISYAREDRTRAATLAEALERQGWAVWWDLKIPPGKTYDQILESAIESSKCVVVLWSETSVGSDWVKNEAEEAKERGTLVPAMIDAVKPPLSFRHIQAADLVNWKGKPDHSGFRALLEELKERIQGGVGTVESEVEQAGKEGEPRTRPVKTGSLKLLAALQLAAILVMTYFAFVPAKQSIQPRPAAVKQEDRDPSTTQPLANPYPLKSEIFLVAGVAALFTGARLGRLSWDSGFKTGVVQGWLFPLAGVGLWYGMIEGMGVPLLWVQVMLVVWGVTGLKTLQLLGSRSPGDGSGQPTDSD